MTYDELMQKAIEASQKAYAPYSQFRVGACLITAGGKIYTGCNFENASYGLSICAERNAVGSAIADGETEIKAIAIYSPNQDNCLPCGACRQVLHEFCTNPSELDIILKVGDELKVVSLESIFPEGFSM